MNFFQILTYINKISLITFIIVFVFFIYHIYLFEKDLKSKKQRKLLIPDFNENIKNNINYTPLLNREKKQNISFFEKKSLFFIYGLVLVLFTFFIFLFIVFKINFKFKNNKNIVRNNNNYQLISPTLTFLINENSLSKQKNINLTPTLTLIPTISLFPTEETILLKISISPTKIFYYLTNTPIKIDQLPISGSIDKTFVLLTPGIILILFSLIF